MAQTYRINLLVGNKEPQRTDIKLCSGDHGMLFDIRVKDFDTTGTTAQIVFHKADGNVVESSLTGSDGIYTYEILGNELAYPGPVVADVKFRTEDSRVSTTKFTFVVDPDTLNDTPIESGAYSTSLEEAIQRAIDAAEIAEGAVEGLDGFSPIANVVKVGTTATITITDVLGTTTAEIHDGLDGGGTGDMTKSVYDPTNKAQDIFAYADGLVVNKADKARNYTATLLSSGWVGSSAPYTQTVTISGITSADEPFVDVVLSGVLATAINEETAYSLISKVITGSGNIVATCNKNKPTINLNLKLKVVD